MGDPDEVIYNYSKQVLQKKHILQKKAQSNHVQNADSDSTSLHSSDS